jgi:hypothetical protein
VLVQQRPQKNSYHPSALVAYVRSSCCWWQRCRTLLAVQQSSTCSHVPGPPACSTCLPRRRAAKQHLQPRAWLGGLCTLLAAAGASTVRQVQGGSLLNVAKPHPHAAKRVRAWPGGMGTGWVTCGRSVVCQCQDAQQGATHMLVTPRNMQPAQPGDMCTLCATVQQLWRCLCSTGRLSILWLPCSMQGGRCRAAARTWWWQAAAAATAAAAREVRKCPGGGRGTGSIAVLVSSAAGVLEWRIKLLLLLLAAPPPHH